MSTQHPRIEILRRALEFCARLDAILARGSAATGVDGDAPEPKQADMTRDD